jgi:riboflavin transporter FmnP
MKNSRIRKLSVTAVMSALAAILMYIETPMPFFPFFLKLDPSDLPAIICSFAVGPLWGVGVQLFKNIIHALSTQTMIAGEIANFFVGAAFVLPAGIVYNILHTKKGAVIGLIAGTVTMALTGIFTNLYITLPVYSLLMPIEDIIKKAANANSLIKDKISLIIYGITPFNLFKGILISTVTLLVYKPLSPILHFNVKSRNADINEKN